jgi:hypothetical protein
MPGGEPGATEGPIQKPAEPFQRQTGADIGSYSEAANKISEPFPRQVGGDVPSFSEAGKKISSIVEEPEGQTNASKLEAIIGKPLTQEQAQANTGRLIEKYLSTIKGTEVNVSSTENAPTMSPEDMADFVATLKEKGVVSEEGAVRLSDAMQTYKETGNFPTSNAPSPK